jgi:hypothetical protein
MHWLVTLAFRTFRTGPYYLIPGQRWWFGYWQHHEIILDSYKFIFLYAKALMVIWRMIYNAKYFVKIYNFCISNGPLCKGYAQHVPKQKVLWLRSYPSFASPSVYGRITVLLKLSPVSSSIKEQAMSQIWNTPKIMSVYLNAYVSC